MKSTPECLTRHRLTIAPASKQRHPPCRQLVVAPAGEHHCPPCRQLVVVPASEQLIRHPARRRKCPPLASPAWATNDPSSSSMPSLDRELARQSLPSPTISRAYEKKATTRSSVLIVVAVVDDAVLPPPTHHHASGRAPSRCASKQAPSSALLPTHHRASEQAPSSAPPPTCRRAS